MNARRRPVSKQSPRLSASVLRDHLALCSPEARRIVKALRATVLKAAPTAAEAIKFHVLSYYRPGEWLGSIGGNICMIEVKNDSVLLSFIRGARLDDPAGLLFGKGKCKRFVRVCDTECAGRKDVRALIRAAAALPPFDEQIVNDELGSI